MIRSLMCVIICTRPDITHRMRTFSRYMPNQGKEHQEAVNWLLKYLRGTYNTSNCYSNSKVVPQDLVDVGLRKDVDSRKSNLDISTLQMEEPELDVQTSKLCCSFFY